MSDVNPHITSGGCRWDVKVDAIIQEQLRGLPSSTDGGSGGVSSPGKVQELNN